MHRRVKNTTAKRVFVTSKRNTIYPSEEIPFTYYTNIRFYLVILRGLGRYPYSLPDDGRVEFQLLSWPTLYTMMFFFVQTIWTTYTLHYVYTVKIEESTTYDAIMYASFFAAFIVQNFAVPLTYWRNSQKMNVYTDSWRKFQEEFGIQKMDFSKPTFLKFYIDGFLPVSTIYLHIEAYRLIGVPLVAFFPFTAASGATMVSLSLWCSTLVHIRMISNQLLSNIIMESSKDIKRTRKMWMSLQKLMTNLGNNFGHIGLFASIAIFLTFLLSIYGLLALIFGFALRNISIFGLVYSGVGSATTHLIICDIADGANEELSRRFSSRFLQFDYSNKSKEYLRELSLLLQIMQAQPPSVQYLSFITVNRRLFVSFISNSVTYLLILLQFKMSSLTNSITADYINSNNFTG